jgi:hypothetical protein
MAVSLLQLYDATHFSFRSEVAMFEAFHDPPTDGSLNPASAQSGALSEAGGHGEFS